MLFQKIQSIYKEILEEKNIKIGYYERRLLIDSKDLNLIVYLGVRIPGSLFYFSFVIPKVLISEFQADKTSGLSVTFKDDATDKVRVTISLEDERFSDLFVILANDLIELILNNKDEKKILIKLSNRLNKWKEFLKESKSSNLTKEALIGLVGELIILNQLLKFDSSIETLLTWKGPFGNKNDFVKKNKSIEVKTSIEKTKNIVRISSEFQLDTNEIEFLNLVVVKLDSDIPEGKGFSLPELVSNTMKDKDAEWQVNFKMIMKVAGYSFDSEELYTAKRFIVNQINIYDVLEEFPKICGSELSINLSEVKYDLNLNGLEKFLLNKDIALKEFLT
jgi:hypothetical protein